MPLIHLLVLHIDLVVRFAVPFLKIDLLIMIGSFYLLVKLVEKFWHPVYFIDGVLIILLQSLIPELTHAVAAVQE